MRRAASSGYSDEAKPVVSPPRRRAAAVARGEASRPMLRLQHRRALAWSIALPWWSKAAVAAVALACIALAPASALAHHILGIPHYAYDEDYPQTPVLTYLVDVGGYEVKMMGYPGLLEPGERCSLHVYIRRLDDGEPFDGTVTLTVTEDALIGSDPVVYGPITAKLDERVYKFFPRFAAVSNYQARVTFEAGGVPFTIDLPMVVGEPGSPWAVVGACAAVLLIFLIAVRATRIKIQRRRAGESVATPAAARRTRPAGRRRRVAQPGPRTAGGEHSEVAS